VPNATSRRKASPPGKRSQDFLHRGGFSKRSGGVLQSFFALGGRGKRGKKKGGTSASLRSTERNLSEKGERGKCLELTSVWIPEELSGGACQVPREICLKRDIRHF